MKVAAFQPPVVALSAGLPQMSTDPSPVAPVVSCKFVRPSGASLYSPPSSA